MKKVKVFYALMIALVCILSINTVKAVDIWDVDGKTGVYKISESDSSYIVPFVRASQDRMEVDQEIEQTGLFCCNSSVEVLSNLPGLKAIFSNDTLRINGDIDYLFACANGNTIINNNVNKTMLVYCSQKVTLSETSNVKGNLIVISPELEINGKVEGVISGTVNNLVVNSNVEGTIKIDTIDATFAEGVTVGTLEIKTTNEKLEVAENVAAAVIERVTKSEENTGSFKEGVFNFLIKIIRDLTVFILALILIKKEGLDKLKEKCVKPGLLKSGLKTYLVIIAIMCFGMLTLIALPAVGVSALIISIGSLIVMTLLKNVIVGTLFVKMAEDRYEQMGMKAISIITALATFALLEAIEMIPYVSGIISFIVFIIALSIVTVMFSKDETAK